MIKVVHLRKDNQIPLMVEEYPENYDGYPFLTLLKYRDTENLVVVDNITDKDIKAYLVDDCATENINEEEFINIVAEWHINSSYKYPLSIEFARRNLTHQMSKILKVYNIDYITRIIGTLPMYEMSKIHSSKKRKRKTIGNMSAKKLKV